MSRLDFDKIKQAFIAETFGDGAAERLESANGYDLDLIGYPLPPAESQRTASRAAPEAMMRRSARLPDLLDQAKQAASLGAYIRKAAHRRDMVSYRPASFEQGQISRDYWSKLLNDEIKPSKEKLLRVAVLLKMGNEDLEELLARAGYAMSPTDLRDVVVAYCLRESLYDFVVIERLLADHDIQSLFNDRRSG
ncbi:MAG: hypothetical protein J7559_00235 [Cohnella sp.]|nr:hypothetical protein [Cohnella sp.]